MPLKTTRAVSPLSKRKWYASPKVIVRRPKKVGGGPENTTTPTTETTPTPTTETTPTTVPETIQKDGVSITTDTLDLDPGLQSEVDRLKQNGLFTPDDIYNWFMNDENGVEHYYRFMYGCGKILKTKEERFQKELDDLDKAIDKTNTIYEDGARAMNYILQPGSPDVAQMKENLNKEITNTINESYQTEYFELIQKKIRYSAALENIRGRRSYLYYVLQQDISIVDENGGETPDYNGRVEIVNTILNAADNFYDLYRGLRYRPICGTLFTMIPMIAYVPDVFIGSLSLNASITGPAGSGKTTMAVEIAKWYSVLNLLTSDEFMTGNNKLTFIQTDRSGLIGEYVGKTAPKTMSVLYGSLEKTLFIDEAYAVPGCSFNKDPNVPDEDAYGNEFVTTLLPFMTNHKGLYSIIIAGYKNLIESCFFGRNEGLPRRFPMKIDLPLYSSDELYAMLPKNIINKRIGMFKGDCEKEIEFKLHRQAFYLGLKPFVMMTHFDVNQDSYPNPFDLLRKYILLFTIMKKQADAQGFEFPDVDKIYSYTILTQILICCLPGSVRRNMMRIEFYDQVFDFKSPNLSYFPAQAGEMELLADHCINKMEKYIQENMNIVNNIKVGGAAGDNDEFDEEEFNPNNFNGYGKLKEDPHPPIPLSITLPQILYVMNSYLDSKRIKFITPRSKDGMKHYFDLILTGYDEGVFLKKIGDFLIHKVFDDGNVPSLVELFQKGMDKDYIDKLTQKIYKIFVDPGDNNTPSIKDKVLNSIKHLPDTKFPVQIDRQNLKTELYSVNYPREMFIKITKLTKEGIESNWEEFGEKVTLEDLEKCRENKNKDGVPPPNTPPNPPESTDENTALVLVKGGQCTTTGNSIERLNRMIGKAAGFSENLLSSNDSNKVHTKMKKEDSTNNITQNLTIPNAVVYNTDGSGECFIHAFMGCVSENYRRIDDTNKRYEIACRFRDEFSKCYKIQDGDSLTGEQELGKEIGKHTNGIIKHSSQYMKKCSEYLEHIHINDIANTFHVNICVINLIDPYSKITIMESKNNNSEHNPYIFIYNISESHYETMSVDGKFYHTYDEYQSLSNSIQQYMPTGRNTKINTQYDEGVVLQHNTDNTQYIILKRTFKDSNSGTPDLELTILPVATNFTNGISRSNINPPIPISNIKANYTIVKGKSYKVEDKDGKYTITQEVPTGGKRKTRKNRRQNK